MTDTYKFPGGNDVKVLRKEDIINTINCNIVDKEVALAIVKQCEIDAANFLRKGRWTVFLLLVALKFLIVLKWLILQSKNNLLKMLSKL